MGVKGDGIEKPGILGSHSYGEVPVINSRQTFAGAETTATSTLRFNDPRAELFTYDIQVTAYQHAPGAGGGAAGGASGGSAGGTSQSGLTPASLIRVAANPLTKTLSVKLVNALK